MKKPAILAGIFSICATVIFAQTPAQARLQNAVAPQAAGNSAATGYGSTSSSLIQGLQCGAVSPSLALSRRRPRLKDGQLDILVVGSSSTAGVGAGATGEAYPALVQKVLRARFGRSGRRLAIRVTPRGVGGEKAKGALRRLKREIRRAKPDLLVWQVGTNDAVGKVPIAALARQIRKGVGEARALGLPVVLVDPQYFPRIAKDAHYKAVVKTIGELAKELRAPLVRRFDRMRSAESLGRKAVDAFLARDRFHMSALGHRCLALDLAETILPRRSAVGVSMTP